ncbi:3-deoxy-manno-octulosonate cytidylyltransferase (CMP-KDO synthetase) [Pedobacter psychrotolerans]|uniref:3-deoxy-manno-octulosonate cytidylyltransferase n=1 Tax=Pedobacter psychrotolerans TaxID=1843235 RepID=A0A4R2H3J9_9SPHI|nr:3-deoxy-manno-octulosonate cytidylyltransferase [Pedobacter psychrotolerans]TCO19861.1 3-deoxy-manno-octulosonate cytidylyltransferase (CMP-KDO synthetase) [Pedobacter psychrotolerans]GGE49405.1 3-deoxy-manno-octulosonate cytidylyltransferase [Pedobacter psychrotolerans]
MNDRNSRFNSENSQIIGIIPARYASTRFPGKPLVDIAGKSMIQRVYEQALKAKSLSKVVIATDDQRIAAEVEKFGGEFVFTAAHHQSGTDRCAEVIEQLPEFDIVINIQGDEPFIEPAQINLLASCFAEDKVELATLIKPIQSQESIYNPNSPKVVIDINGRAMYFSRSPIPFIRNGEPGVWAEKHQFYKHIGIYGYRTESLKAITKLPQSALEIAESLEQLRWIENGFYIQTKVTDLETVAIDTPEDLLKLNKLLEALKLD